MNEHAPGLRARPQQPSPARGGRGLGRAVRAVTVGAALLVAAALAALAPLDAAAQSPSTIDGAVRNGTAGAPPPEGLSVTLRYQVASGELAEQHAVTDAAGAFTFTDLPPQGLPGYEVRTEYLDVPYTERVLGEPLAGPLSLTVYEITTDFGVLSVVDDTLAVTGADGGRREFAALEAVKLRNTSDRTFRADTLADGPMSMVRFSLPEGAAELEVEASLPGGHVLQVDRGFALTMPVPPGEHDILYIYRVPYAAASKEYSPNFPMGAEAFRVMVVEGVAEGAGPGFSAADPIALGETRYAVLEAGPLAPGERAALTLTALPEPTPLELAANIVGSDGFRRGVLPASLGALLCVLVGGFLLRRRVVEARARPVDGGPSTATRAAVIEAIARLDARHDAGEVDGASYQLERAALLQRAREAE